jgi:ornithine carbamoyltransferase
MSLFLKGRSLVSMTDLSREEIRYLLKTADLLKTQRRSGAPHPLLAGKTLGMIFEKPSTRTRVSFEVGMNQLGGHPLYLSSAEMQLKRGETVADTARVLSRYVDGIMARVYSHANVADLAKYASVPVINGLSDEEHPCQILGDLFTLWEKREKLKGLKMAYLGDGNNVCNSLLLGCALMGVHIHTAHPEGYFPDAGVVKKAAEIASESGSEVIIGGSPTEAAHNADALYTDVWISMGQENSEEKKKAFTPYQVNGTLLSHAHQEAIVLHCLPAHRGEEITDEMMDGPRSAVFDQAENRLHIQKAIMASLM